MWSVWYFPKPGSARIACRASSLAGFAVGDTVNSRTSLVIRRLYNRALSSFWIDERWAYHFAFDTAAADVDSDVLAILDTRVDIDQRQRDTDFQRRRKRARRGDPDRGVAVENIQVWPQHTATDRAQTPQQPPRARLFFGQQGLAAEERVLLPADRPAATGQQRVEHHCGGVPGRQQLVAVLTGVSAAAHPHRHALERRVGVAHVVHIGRQAEFGEHFGRPGALH